MAPPSARRRAAFAGKIALARSFLDGEYYIGFWSKWISAELYEIGYRSSLK